MSRLRTILSDVALGESPRWHDSRLWFSDWGTQQIIAVDVEGNRKVVVADTPALPVCIDWLPDGRLLVVAGREGRLLRREAGGSLVTHADLSGQATTPWNEIVVDGRGNTFLNNTGFDFPGGEYAPGFVTLVTPTGDVRRVADSFAFPNGMAVTPDNTTLIVAESYASRLTAFNIDDDGSLSNRRVWAEIDGSAPDGICLDADNAVWYADVPNRRCVRVREGGEVLQTIELDRGGFACALGGDDHPTLFILAADWHGPSSLTTGERSGLLVAVDAPYRRAGWP